MVVAGRLITAALPVASTIVPALRFTAVESRSREVSPATTVYVPLNVVAGPAGPVMVTAAPDQKLVHTFCLFINITQIK